MVTSYMPQTLGQALNILSSKECILLAGGTDLMVKNRGWQGTVPDFKRSVVFISMLKELRNIYIKDEFLGIGAACTFNEIIENNLVPDFIKSIFMEIASPAVRNTATIGGNICNSSPAGDSLPLLYAMESYVNLKSMRGERNLPVSQFILGPGKNAIQKDEILTEISIPIKNFNIKYYKKVGTRKSTALSKLSFIGLASVNGRRIEDIRIAFGAVGPTVVRDKDIEEGITRTYDNDGKIDIEMVKEMFSRIIKPIDDQRSTALYRKNVCLRLLEDFLNNKLAACFVKCDAAQPRDQ